MVKATFQSKPSWKPLSLPEDSPPQLAVVIDTEEEFDWNAPFSRDERGTRNILEQPLAQEIMDRHGIVPTYVVDYPVTEKPEASSVLRTILEEGRCEIGAHLHPWVNPPYAEVVNEVHSFPGNLPPEIEHEKLSCLSERIENVFKIRPSIYKAGRYGLGPETYTILQDLGFNIDVSIVPYTNFSDRYGPNFTTFTNSPFQASPTLKALPLSVHFVGALANQGPIIYPKLTTEIGAKARIAGIAARLRLLERLRLSPEGHNASDLKRQVLTALANGERYFMLTYHSSSLLPKATNYVLNKNERDLFLKRLNDFFVFFLDCCNGEAKSVSELANLLRIP